MLTATGMDKIEIADSDSALNETTKFERGFKYLSGNNFCFSGTRKTGYMKALGKLEMIAKQKRIGECITEEPWEGKPHARFCKGFHNNKTFMKGVRVMNSTRQKILLTLLMVILLPTQCLAQAEEMLIGEYVCYSNPCDTDPCLHGVVWTVVSDDKIYHLTKGGEWIWDCELTSWNGYIIKEGDTVILVGEISEGIDIRGKPYINIEVEYLFPIACLAEVIHKEVSGFVSR